MDNFGQTRQSLSKFSFHRAGYAAEADRQPVDSPFSGSDSTEAIPTGLLPYEDCFRTFSEEELLTFRASKALQPFLKLEKAYCDNRSQARKLDSLVNLAREGRLEDFAEALQSHRAGQISLYKRQVNARDHMKLRNTGKPGFNALSDSAPAQWQTTYIPGLKATSRNSPPNPTSHSTPRLSVTPSTLAAHEAFGFHSSLLDAQPSIDPSTPDHVESAQDVSPTGRHLCPFDGCGMDYTKLGALANHVRTKHSKEESPGECRICLMRFPAGTRSGAVADHIEASHNRKTAARPKAVAKQRAKSFPNMTETDISSATPSTN